MLSRDTPAPNGLRLRRACAAFYTFGKAVWGPDKAPKLMARPGWLQEQWAQVADAIIEIAGAQIDAEGHSEHLREKRARAAAKKRDALEGRDGDGSPEALSAWKAVVDAVMQAEHTPWESL